MATPPFNDKSLITGRSRRGNIRKPARFRDSDSEEDTPSISRSRSVTFDMSDMASVDDSRSNGPSSAPKRGRGRPRGSVTKRQKTKATSPSPPPRLQYPAYPQSAFPSRPMTETPEQRAASEKQAKHEALQKWLEEDDTFGETWEELEPCPHTSVIDLHHHIISAFIGRAKRAFGRDDLDYVTFMTRELREVHLGDIPATIGDRIIIEAIDECMNEVADIFDISVEVAYADFNKVSALLNEEIQKQSAVDPKREDRADSGLESGSSGTIPPPPELATTQKAGSPEIELSDTTGHSPFRVPTQPALRLVPKVPSTNRYPQPPPRPTRPVSQLQPPRTSGLTPPRTPRGSNGKFTRLASRPMAQAIARRAVAEAGISIAAFISTADNQLPPDNEVDQYRDDEQPAVSVLDQFKETGDL